MKTRLIRSLEHWALRALGWARWQTWPGPLSDLAWRWQLVILRRIQRRTRAQLSSARAA